MTNFERFLQWEETDRDTIKVKRMYVDIAGDLAAGPKGILDRFAKISDILDALVDVSNYIQSKVF